MAAFLKYLFTLPTQDPDYRPDMNFLIDASEARSTGRSSEEERSAVSDFMGDMPETFKHKLKVATVITKDLEYGLSRMYKTYLDLPFIDYKLFEDLETAVAWVELPDAAVAAIRSLD